jgi:glycosyltransferase involved in cell wall biosynthesis
MHIKPLNPVPSAPKTLLIVANSGWNLVNFRSGLIKALQRAGHIVICAAPNDISFSELERLGCNFLELKISPQSLNPLKDLWLMAQLMLLMQRTQAQKCLFFTAKPNIFGSLCASLLGIEFINNISGLGSVFIENGLLSKFMCFLYKLALKKSTCVFFQNPDDRDFFILKNIVRLDQTQLLPGSGVDLNRYRPALTKNHSKPGEFRFILIARMIRDKGVYEYIEAAKVVHSHYPYVQFNLLGFLGVENPTAVSHEQINEWNKLSFIHYLGEAEDVREFISQSDCVVLPSYREGTPKALLEAAAMAKPIITTNVPGCKEVVDDSVNGYLVEVKNTKDLAKKMCKMIELTEVEREEMGRCGRIKMERQFNEEIVFSAYLKVI